MRRTNIYLDEGQIVALDQISAERGVSRAEVIRTLIGRALADSDRDLELDLAGLDAAFGALADEGIDQLRTGDDARSRHLADAWNR